MPKFVELTSVYGERFDVVTEVGEVSLTRQEFAEECDINSLMARYDKVGGWPFMPPVENYMDFAFMPGSLQEALTQLNDSKEAFMRLPASARKEFDNDPLRFVEFAADGNNVAKLREWGLAEPEKVPERPVEVRVVSDPIPDPAKPVASAK